MSSLGLTLQIVGEMLAEAADVRAGEQVLDVAAATGDATLAAARRFARVTSTDPAAAPLDRGHDRARAEGFDVRFMRADARALPFAERSFDVVLSCFGAMDTPDPGRVAAEMLRVVRPGGRIGLVAWTREGFVGRLLERIGTDWPTRWGSEVDLARWFDGRSVRMRCRPRRVNLRYRSAEHALHLLRAARGAMPAELEPELLVLFEAANVGGSGALVVPAGYLEVVMTVPC